MSLRRLNYFKGQFLKAKDFQEEQQYHIENLKNHNKSLHTWGIIEGLMVQLDESGKTIVVKKGSAIDPEGHMLLLEKPESIEAGSLQKFFYIVLTYHEVLTDPATETGITGHTRIVETTKIEMPISADVQADLILAKVNIRDKDTIEIDLSPRRYTGITLFAEGDDAPQITGKIFDAKEDFGPHKGREYGIYVKSPWVEMNGRLKTQGLANSGNTLLGDPGDDDQIIINGIIFPRRASNTVLPVNKVPGSKLQVCGDIEFQQMLMAPKDMLLSSGGDISLICTNGVYIKKNRERGGFSGNLIVEGNLSVSGSLSAVSKQFVIDHPLDPEEKILVHCALEGPEVAVYYRGEGEIKEGEAIISLPEYFEALTRKENRTVLLTPIHEGGPVSALSTSPVHEGKFRVKGIDKNNPNQKFYWEVKAIRADVPALEVERKKV